MVEVKPFFKKGEGFRIPSKIHDALEVLFIEYCEDLNQIPDFANDELTDLLGARTPLHAIFVARNEQKRTVGMCFATKHQENTWGLGGAFVAESHRGQRIFSVIMAAVKTAAREENVRFLLVEPSVEGPEYWRPAMARWGFREIEGKDDEWQMDLRKIKR